MRRFLLVARVFVVRLVHGVARGLPIQERVVLATSHSDVLTGNLAWIRDELARRTPHVRIVTIASRPRTGPRGIARAAATAIRGSYYLATSRVFVVDDNFPIFAVRRRPGTTLVQAWHAAGAFKKVRYSLVGKSFGAAATSLEPIAANYDICLVSSLSFAPYYSEAFRLPLDRFVSTIGIPRTDVFFGAHRAAALSRAKSRYPAVDGRTVVLYAPTFRGDTFIDARDGALLDLRVLKEKLGRDHVVMLRLHPVVQERAALDASLRDFVIDASGDPDVNELMLVSDVLVTDYSSVIFEFALLERPMVFFAPDLEAYERERGFYFDYRSGVPGPVLETSEAVAEVLRAGRFDLDRVRAFAKSSFDVADGRSSGRFVDQIVMPMLAAGGAARQ
ncbi:MAG TPA: CDP-glycerol glycerophosphotransferase family protein [Candidatus Limnocylindrales bacterium]|nr:CDP-glycerol glycerophosphotransferase family protein [Candidatus Limnocylindrales bacterium]